MGQDITLDELDALNDAILKRHGIDFTHYEPKSFSRRVSRAIDYFGLNNLMELWSKVLNDRAFVFDFIDAITVGMTSFFRDPQMWRILKSDVLMQMKHQDKIRVWHAGCSTGEEAYTFGIVLQDTKLQHKVEALATDLNRESVDKSIRGEYDNLTLRQNTQQFSEYNPFKKFEDYYTLGEKTFTMNKDLVKHVNFQVGNMISDDVPGKFDIIFCRNVLIYFDETLKRKMLEKFYEKLTPDGFLVIGYFDALIPVLDKEMWEFYNLAAKIFQKIPYEDEV